MNAFHKIIATLFCLITACRADAEVKVLQERSEFDLGFAFASVPSPASNDAATRARFSVVDGEADSNSGSLSVLQDGRVSGGEDRPTESFFFRAGTEGGRIRIDLGEVIQVRQIASYSWHSGDRGPQVYKLYGSDGASAGFEPGPKKGIDPAGCGWKLIASVDTRSGSGNEGGQHGVAIIDSEGVIGSYRYIMFDVARTEDRDIFGNTFYCELDVLSASGPQPVSIVPKHALAHLKSADGRFLFTIDTTAAPDLKEWCEKDLQPLVVDWYPRIVKLLAEEGYQAPERVLLDFRNDLGKNAAVATGARIQMNAGWFRDQLKGEARGCVVHEMVHVVQNYSRRSPKTRPVPGWIVEGIADYVRWFLYEPGSRGAEITKANLATANYDSSYRITGNFLDWVSNDYGGDILQKLNAAARGGSYDDSLWKDWTGKSIQQLGSEWKLFHEQRLGHTGPPAAPDGRKQKSGGGAGN